MHDERDLSLMKTFLWFCVSFYFANILFHKNFQFTSDPQYMSCIYPANSQTWILSDLIRCDSIRNVTEMFWKDKDFFLKPRDKVCHHENWFCGQISQEIHLTVSFQLQFFVYFNFVFGKLNFKTKIFLIL